MAGNWKYKVTEPEVLVKKYPQMKNSVCTCFQKGCHSNSNILYVVTNEKIILQRMLFTVKFLLYSQQTLWELILFSVSVFLCVCLLAVSNIWLDSWFA